MRIDLWLFVGQQRSQTLLLALIPTGLTRYQLQVWDLKRGGVVDRYQSSADGSWVGFIDVAKLQLAASENRVIWG